MQIERVIVGPLATNCYIIFDNVSKKGFVIDPGAEPNLILSIIDKEQLDINYILLTHGHADHIAAVPALKESLHSKVVIHEADEYMLKNDTASLGTLFGVSHSIVEIDVTFNSSLQAVSETFTSQVDLLETPGHTSGSACFYFSKEGVLFSGDTLFANGVGRTDLKGGDEQALFESLEKIKRLPKDTIIYPGHGKEFRLGRRFKTVR